MIRPPQGPRGRDPRGVPDFTLKTPISGDHQLFLAVTKIFLGGFVHPQGVYHCIGKKLGLGLFSIHQLEKGLKKGS